MSETATQADSPTRPDEAPPPAVARRDARADDPGHDPGEQPGIAGAPSTGPLGHADWHGWTPTDLIFPFFLFMVGVAMAYSFAKYTTGEGPPTAAVWLRISAASRLLILLGLALNASGRLISVPAG